MGLDQLRRKLLYNDITDVWIALCEERKWNWEDFQSYKGFIKFLESKNIRPQKLMVCPAGSGRKADFTKKSSALLGDYSKSFVIRTDDRTVADVRTFNPNLV